MTFLNLALGNWTLPHRNVYITGANLLSLGIFLVPIIPVSMNFASELTFPIAPATTNGMLLMCGNAMGAIVGVIGSPICKKNPRYMLSMEATMALLAFICTMFMEENLKKLNFAKRKTTEEDMEDHQIRKDSE